MLSLYLATDRRYTDSRDLCDVVAACIANGVTAVQLREKDCSASDFCEMGRRLLAVTRGHGVPLIINDRVDIMLAIGADGVHVGRGDLPLREARRLAGDRILGYSVNSLAHLRFAESAGADYVGIGPAFATGTKTDTGGVLGPEGIRGIARCSSIPCVAIGGVHAGNVAELGAAGVDGVCVISGILAQSLPAAAAAELRRGIDAW